MLTELKCAMLCRGKSLTCTSDVSTPSTASQNRTETANATTVSTTVALAPPMHAEQAVVEDRPTFSKHQKKQHKAAKKKNGGKQSKADNRYSSVLGLKSILLAKRFPPRLLHRNSRFSSLSVNRTACHEPLLHYCGLVPGSACITG